MEYPKVLVLAIGRVNDSDSSSNGLLLRNIFARFPRENLAQIYSGGSNGDAGFFGHYYKLNAYDRWFGKLFFKYKSKSEEGGIHLFNRAVVKNQSKSVFLPFRRIFLNWFIDSGFYELIFRPRLSWRILKWISEFKPDILFTQGYNLTFTWLPLMIDRKYNLPIIYYPTDDWPDRCYKYGLTKLSVFARLTLRNYTMASKKLVKSATVHLAFNYSMKNEYSKRYKTEFYVLMHGDDFKRFESAVPRRSTDDNIYCFVCTGAFDYHRFPLIDDLDAACKILNSNNIKCQTIVYSVNSLNELPDRIYEFHYVTFKKCPSHEDLVSFLRGADILILPERFGETSASIRLSVSSKSHLFMFSGRPIIVYSDSRTGVAQYGKAKGWAEVVDIRDPEVLAKTIETLIKNRNKQEKLIERARNTAMKNHQLSTIQDSFLKLLVAVVQQ